MHWNSLLSPDLKWRVPVFLSTTAFAMAISRQSNGFQNGPTLCLIKLATGLNCPFCGTTRAVGEILLFDIASAADLNLYGFVVVGIAISWLVNPHIPSRLWTALSQISLSRVSGSQVTILTLFGAYSIFMFVTRNI
jgi:hypothetical protein